jgi:DNA polymerase-3 subunit gamma/tau
VSSYQVLARKWRPQRFEDVIGQRGVTQTLRNAIAAKRIAQSFVFSGPRGVGKTTTARILARGLNCENGPTAEPCGRCDACIEIAQGRDIDVLEIDAATNTQVDKVREIIIAGLGMAPVRNRYKIFIIDEVHRLSNQAFDALLKSIEEPPPHVVFMMATTEIDKVPATIQSRSQVFELKTIAVKQIADQLRRIADAEGIQIDDDALMLIARAGDGSMRDAQSAFDQVIAFAGDRIAAEDVATVLGLVRRDLLFDIAAAVADEEGAKAFELAGQAVESGYDLRAVVRELGRLTRDLLVVRIDASRVTEHRNRALRLPPMRP